MHVNATAHPTDAWVAQLLREATPFGKKAKHLICDHDTKYRPAFHATAKTCGLKIIHTPYEAPRANAICERFVGSLRRECLDHVLVLGNRHRVRAQREYTGYFNQARPQQGLVQLTPEASQLNPASMPTAPRTAIQASLRRLDPCPGRRLVAAPILNGLHHSYAWATWRRR